ncbi:MAG: cell wall-binding repeat-containing protein [Tetrasphaera sp.]
MFAAAGSSANAAPEQRAEQVTAAAQEARATGVVRWAGADRYEASAAISARSFDPGVPVAYVASGSIYTDALSGAPVAAKSGGPMLLVTATDVPDAIATELSRLRPQRIVVLGGPASIGTGVETRLRGFAGSGGVQRWQGADRFEASAAISRSSFSPGVDTAFVASGRVFADALSGAPVAGRDRDPLLLVDTDRIPDSIDAELRRLRPSRIVVLGGPASISDGVAAELSAYSSGWVERWFGADRYAASAEISAASFDPGVPVAFVAYGQVFSDALSGAPVAGIRRGPMLLVAGSEIPSAVRDELRRLQPKQIVVLGGTASISTTVENQLADYVVP